MESSAPLHIGANEIAQAQLMGVWSIFRRQNQQIARWTEKYDVCSVYETVLAT